MAPPRSRRTAARSSNSGKAPIEPTDPPVEDVDVEMPAAPADEFAPQESEAPEESAVSGRRQAGRSARRSARGSAKVSGKTSAKASARSSAKQLTPEELAARRAARMQVIKILLGLVIAGGAAFGIWWFAVRVPPNVETARQTLSKVEVMIKSLETSLTTLRDPAAANSTREEALKLLQDSPELGYAKMDPDINDPKLSTPELARKAAGIKDALLGEWKDRVEKLERDVRVEKNKRRIQSGFAGLQNLKDEELGHFEREMNNFIDNPVLPGSGRNDAYVKEYDVDLAPVRTQVVKITDEKERRDRAITDQPVREAKGLAAIAVQQEKFQDGLAQIDELSRKYPTANFDGVRTYVRESAKMAWETALAAAEENYKTFTAPGTTKDMAEKSLAAARDRMQQVIDRFGIDEYVSQAREALGRFQAKN